MRSTREQVERVVCAEHCRFFKPWGEEKEPCSALQWILQRAEHVEGTLEALGKIRRVRAAQPLSSDALLLRAVCSRCPHYPDDCRYRRAERPAHAVPCGGIAVLDALLGRDTLSAEELYSPPPAKRAQGS